MAKAIEPGYDIDFTTAVFLCILLENETEIQALKREIGIVTDGENMIK